MNDEMLRQHMAQDEKRFDAIDKKLDVLLASANKQRGFIAGVSMAFSMLATTVVGLIVYIWQRHFNGG